MGHSSPLHAAAVQTEQGACHAANCCRLPLAPSPLVLNQACDVRRPRPRLGFDESRPLPIRLQARNHEGEWDVTTPEQGRLSTSEKGRHSPPFFIAGGNDLLPAIPGRATK